MKPRTRRPNLRRRALVVSGFVSLIVFSPGNARAALGVADIIIEAAQGLAAGQTVYEVLQRSLVLAEDNNITLLEISAPLSETLLDTGIRMGGNGVALAEEISSAMLSLICWQQLCVLKKAPTMAEALRCISQTVMGIRAACLRHGLDETQVQEVVQEALASSSGDMNAEILVRVAANAYQDTPPSTYTPPGTLLPPGEDTSGTEEPPPPPEPPSDVPGDLSDRWDTIASRS